MSRSRLSAASLSQLVERCRTAKERLLTADAPESLSVTLLGSGSRLVGGALGLAVLSTIAAGQVSSSQAAVATTNGFGLAYHVGTAFALAGAAIAAFLLHDPADTDVVRLPTTTTTEEAEHEALAA